MLREILAVDITDVCDIYNHYVENTLVTFDEESLSVDQMQYKVEQVIAGYPWLVYEHEGRVLGYAYAAQWKPRSAFRNTVEASVYLREDATGSGLGMQLYQALLDKLRAQGLHLVIAGISLPNEASIRLHRKLGFKEAGRLTQAGYKFDRWVDVSYWQLLL